MICTVQTAPCWYLARIDGSPWDDEFNYHFADEAAAVAEAWDIHESYDPDERPTLILRAEKEPCITLACNECGTVYDGGMSGSMHFTDINEAGWTAADSDWHVCPLGHLCERCS